MAAAAAPGRPGGLAVCHAGAVPPRGAVLAGRQGAFHTYVVLTGSVADYVRHVWQPAMGADECEGTSCSDLMARLGLVVGSSLLAILGTA